MKKNIPLSVLEPLSKYVTLKGKEFDIIEPGSYLLRVLDKDSKSDFYFCVEEYKADQGPKLLVGFKPSSRSNTQEHRGWIEINGLDQKFDAWVDLLKAYDEIPSFYDDPIVSAYANDYYTEFEVVTEDAEVRPLKPKQILLLDKYLQTVESTIDTLEIGENESGIKDIKADIRSLRSKLTAKSQAWVIRHLVIIWAKLTKQGTTFMKEFVSETKRKAIKEGIEFVVDEGTKLIM